MGLTRGNSPMTETYFFCDSYKRKVGVASRCHRLALSAL